MTLKEYLSEVDKKHRSGISREHSYRAALENYIKTLVPEVEVTNEPASVTDCGNPDYVITRKNIPVGYIEAKDIGKDLKKKGYKEQFDRYRKALDNLIITDYLWFRFYVKGELIHEMRIAEIVDGKIQTKPDVFEEFENRICNFCSFVGETIKSPKKLAGMMAAKARLLQNILERAVTSDEDNQQNTSIQGQYKTFKDILIHDLKPGEFADIYAQTLAYGMFAARLNDPTPDDFSRQEAASLIPKTNPFLRKLFQYVAGYDIDERIKPTVDNLAEVFRATNVKALLSNFGSATQQNDPIIHFYETFLGEYDAKLRKARGVWYTPEPVVKFIVRAVDDILKKDFGLKMGLADTSKTKVKVNTQKEDKRSATGYKQVEKEVHKVQILDPATGTGTFLAEVVKYIYNKNFKAMQGAWSGYVENDLIPRLNGFELLMASYAMAHLKLSMLLDETGAKATKDQRFKIYLTNSLEKEHPDTGTLFANWLSSEANEANHIKRDSPVMCIIGNPPYSGESKNKGKWIMGLMEDYKKEPGGKAKLKERNPKWINDDYMKFMRYAQHFIEKNKEGVLAFINPHGFLDNPTFRGVRWNLLKTYDKIYVIDLHGNSKKKEKCPDGSKDDNVFDIQQGVSINLFVKTGKKKGGQLGKIFHYDLFGKRKDKYEYLSTNSIKTILFEELFPKSPMYFFVKKDLEKEHNYNKGVSLNELFNVTSVGIVTSRDGLVVNPNKHDLKKRLQSFFVLEEEEIKNKMGVKENKSWKIKDAQQSSEFDEKYIESYSYRPFDKQYLYYDENFVERNRKDVMQHFVLGDNLGIVYSRQATSEEWTNIQISAAMVDNRYHFSYKGIPNQAPLYLYPNENDKDLFERKKRKSNLNENIIAIFSKKLGLPFVNEKGSGNDFSPVDVLDYAYAILHAPKYRKQYNELLKIDFPRIPYPKDKKAFWALVKQGEKLREIHLLESEKVEDYITSYPITGSNQVTRKMTKTSIGFEENAKDKMVGKVWINDTQYFDGVPKLAWGFYIGGYQPAQKWLKDRRGRTLDFSAILHYQKIIVALTETDRIMKEIDKIDFE